MRTNLKVFRIKLNLSQQQFADSIKINRATYSSIEIGKRSGRPDFWESLRNTYNIPDSDMYALMRNE